MIAIDIRPCTTEDIERFRRLDMPGRVIARHVQKFAAQERGEGVFFVAWDGDRPAGFVTLLTRSKYEVVRAIAGDFPEVNALEATPQGQGIGTALMRHTEAEARRWGAERIGLAVEVDNEGARRLYERLGYTEWGGRLVIDEWFELDDDGAPTVHHADECFYLTKGL